jgi:hypothetical protein
MKAASGRVVLRGVLRLMSELARELQLPAGFEATAEAGIP